MRQVAKKGLLTAVATGGVLAVTTGGFAYADSDANGIAAGSPGVGSGNTIQLPVHVPVNACGNTVNVIGALNPAAGNTCVNSSSGGSRHGMSHGVGHGMSHDTDRGMGNGSDRGARGATAEGAAVGSPGVASGNVVQIPVDVPVNACGNTVNVAGALNPAAGNACINTSPSRGEEHHRAPHHPHHPGVGHHAQHPGHRVEHIKHQPHRPAKEVPVRNQPGVSGQKAKAKESLASTGAGDLGAALAASVGLLLGGTALVRRSRATRD